MVPSNDTRTKSGAGPSSRRTFAALAFSPTFHFLLSSSQRKNNLGATAVVTALTFSLLFPSSFRPLVSVHRHRVTHYELLY